MRLLVVAEKILNAGPDRGSSGCRLHHKFKDLSGDGYVDPGRDGAIESFPLGIILLVVSVGDVIFKRELPKRDKELAAPIGLV